jgi:hypothetical protein
MGEVIRQQLQVQIAPVVIQWRLLAEQAGPRVSWGPPA